MSASIYMVDEVSSERDGIAKIFRGLDTLLTQALEIAPSIYGWEPGTTQFRGLYISKTDAERLLTREPVNSPFGDLGEAPFFSIEEAPRLQKIAERYRLSWFDCAVLLIALAPEIDVRYERLYAYLQDDVSRRRPTVDLVLNLLCPTADERIEFRSHFAPDAPLLRHRLIQLAPDNSQAMPSLISHGIKIDEQIVRELLGSRDEDSRLSRFCRFVTSAIDLASLPLEPPTAEGLRRLLFTRPAADALRICLLGSELPLKQRTAEAIAASLSRPLLICDLRRMGTTGRDASDVLPLITREAESTNSVLFLDMSGSDEQERAAILRELQQCALDIVVSTASAPSGFDALDWTTIDFPPPSVETRRMQWQRSLASEAIDIGEDEVRSLAARFRLQPDQICSAVLSARNRARWRGSGQVSATDLSAAARAASGKLISGMARKIAPVYSWDDIVLPPGTMRQLRAICSRVMYGPRVLGEWGFSARLSMGKGVTVLFAGPSGVGKTMAAEIIASELDIDLYKIDLSGVISKYIGETEKNLDRIFAAAEDANSILFFDEADALFGKRSEVKDSHDRYANIEISYLLQKMEMYDGVAILATNLRQNLDDAFLRRLAFTIHFPFPDQGDRRRIWQTIWPAQVPIHEDVDFDFLAEQFKLSGGNIKNVALAAAFFAAAEDSAVRMRHLLHAVADEFRKLGKPLSQEMFGRYAEAAL